MAQKKPDILPYRIFVGDRPWEEFSPEEKVAYCEKMVRRMGETLERSFCQHPEAYAQFQDVEKMEQEHAQDTYDIPTKQEEV